MPQRKPAKPKTTASTTQRVTKEQLLAAIKACGGIAEHVARKVGISRQGVLKRIKADEDLQAATDEAKQVMLDEAEDGLRAAIKARKSWAIRFALSRLGKDRGYTTSMHVESTVEQTGKVVIVRFPDNGRDGDGNSGGGDD